MSPRSSARGVLLGHMLRAPCEQSLKWKQGQQMPLNKLQGEKKTSTVCLDKFQKGKKAVSVSYDDRVADIFQMCSESSSDTGGVIFLFIFLLVTKYADFWQALHTSDLDREQTHQCSFIK